MLYDPKWEKPEVKADPFSLESLIAWLEKQPAQTLYDFDDCDECLVGKYLIDITGTDNPSGVTVYSALCGGAAAYHHIAVSRPWTFGAALERARALSL